MLLSGSPELIRVLRGHAFFNREGFLLDPQRRDRARLCGYALGQKLLMTDHGGLSLTVIGWPFAKTFVQQM